MNTKLAVLYILSQSLRIARAGLAMLWAAGRLDWWPAWAVITVRLVWFMGNA